MTAFLPTMRAADPAVYEHRRTIPLHPTRITAYHKSDEYAVVAVDGRRSVMDRDDAVISSIEASIREWLFLPKLQNGQPIECVVQFPVEVSVE